MINNSYIIPDKNRNILSNNKQMEYNTKYKKQLDLLKYLADKNNAEMKICGTFNTKYFIDNVSDIDVNFYSDNPYVVYHNLKNEIQYRKLMQRDFTYERPCGKDKCVGYGTLYKINFLYDNMDISIMIINNKDKIFFQNMDKENNSITYYYGFLIYLIKYIYYKLKLISKEIYKKFKVFIYTSPLIKKHQIKYKDNIISTV
jgi:hypothetical protein